MDMGNSGIQGGGGAGMFGGGQWRKGDTWNNVNIKKN